MIFVNCKTITHDFNKSDRDLEILSIFPPYCIAVFMDHFHNMVIGVQNNVYFVQSMLEERQF